MLTRFLLTRAQAVLFAVLIFCLPVLSADFAMQVADNGYLDAHGFSVVLYQNTYHPIFVDEKNAAMQMMLHGQRIATNGDVRMVPTPEQWDVVAQLKGHTPTRGTTALARLSFPAYQMDYTLR